MPPDWDAWRASRPERGLVHLDSAAAGRSSLATLAATAAHARREAEVGAYVAAGEVADLLEGLRSDLAVLLGTDGDGLAFVESASAARAALLQAWPLPGGARIGVLPVEWGPNLEVFTGHGLTLQWLPADGDGRLDLDAFERLLAHDPPDVVHLTQVTSHRGLVQPTAAAATLCRAAGIPVWVDAAQALGHVDATSGADAVYATSRKWLTGPRGIGLLGIAAPYREVLRVPTSAMDPEDRPVRRLDSHEAHVAGRVGLATAVAEYRTAGPAAVHDRLEQVGRQTRAALADVPGWQVVAAAPPTGAITALRPSAGQDLAAVAAGLLAAGILATAGSTVRAPHDRHGPLLRVSPHVDLTDADLEQLARTLPAR